MLVIIAYDITDDRRRAEVAGLLLGWGERVQESVFECWLNANELRCLKEALADLVDETTDRVRFYRLCRKDTAGIRCQGLARPPADWSLRVL